MAGGVTSAPPQCERKRLKRKARLQLDCDTLMMAAHTGRFLTRQRQRLWCSSHVCMREAADGTHMHRRRAGPVHTHGNLWCADEAMVRSSR